MAFISGYLSDIEPYLVWHLSLLVTSDAGRAERTCHGHASHDRVSRGLASRDRASPFDHFSIPIGGPEAGSVSWNRCEATGNAKDDSCPWPERSEHRSPRPGSGGSEWTVGQGIRRPVFA